MHNTLDSTRRYRNDILSWRASELGLSYEKVAYLTAKPNRAPISSSTVERVLKGGNASFDTVWAIADALDIDRHALTNFDLKERQFRQAVTNGKRV